MGVVTCPQQAQFDLLGIDMYFTITECKETLPTIWTTSVR